MGSKQLHGGDLDSTQDGGVTVQTSRSRVRLVLAGQVDASMNSELAGAASEIARLDLPVDVDTQPVTFMDSTAIATLVHLATRLTSRIRIIQPPELVRFLLDVAQVGDLVDILDVDPGFPEATPHTPAWPQV